MNFRLNRSRSIPEPLRVEAAKRKPVMLSGRVLVILSVLGGLLPAGACMNDYQPNQAAIERSHTLAEGLTRHPTKEPWPQRRDRLRKESAGSNDFRLLNDLATALAHTGEAAESVTLLEGIEALHPGLYFTAANLGTAYELTGDNQKALEWIRRGIDRNPAAHNGTEWLHVRILEAKLAMSADPGWLNDHSILDGKDLAGRPNRNGMVEASATGNGGEPLTTNQIKKAIRYQLHERLQFVKAPDTVVGALLLELAVLVAGEPTGAGGSVDILKLAFAYLAGLPETENLWIRAANLAMRAQRGQRISPPPNRLLELGVLAGSGVVLSGVLIGLLRLSQRLRRRARR